MTRPRYLALLLVILATAATLRTVWLRADPPQISVEGVGVVWHDEGAWTHNARNKALWGQWETDSWNPVFIAPVFTALEYVAFREFGVGLWQARLVPAVSGLIAVIFLAAGLSAAGGRRPALIGGALLATNYAFVMWNRAALMESTMTALIVVAWASYAMAEKRSLWGMVAGVAVVLAWFTKAASAFFAAAIVVDALITLTVTRSTSTRDQTRAATTMLISLGVAALAVGALFVWPHWNEYQFYNWQMSVVRKPDYHLRSFLDRASWLPVVQSIFMRMWLVLAAAAVSLAAILARWREARPAERLLVLWVAVGFLELVVHDSSNDRRYVMFIPAMVALASLLFAASRPILPKRVAELGRGRILALPVLLFLSYLVLGTAVRPLFLADIAANHFYLIVRVSAALSFALSAIVLWQWRRLVGWLSDRSISPALALGLVVVGVGWNLFEFERWAASRRETNYEASVALGRLLPDGTLVQGKLANGLALDNRIRPIFIGNHFGNYDDRLQRDDVRYILTYDLPSVGYESQADSGLIQELLDHYPQRHTVATFEVDETPAPDRAALIDKRPK